MEGDIWKISYRKKKKKKEIYVRGNYEEVKIKLPKLEIIRKYFSKPEGVEPSWSFRNELFRYKCVLCGEILNLKAPHYHQDVTENEWSKMIENEIREGFLKIEKITIIE